MVNDACHGLIAEIIDLAETTLVTCMFDAGDRGRQDWGNRRSETCNETGGPADEEECR